MQSAPSPLPSAEATRDFSFRLARVGVCPDDACVLLTSQPNLLLSGPDATTADVLQVLWPLLRQPVWETSGAAFALPPGLARTVVVRHAAGLTFENQQRLWQWVGDHEPRIRLVTTSPEPIFPLVARGVFLKPLYYLLNTMYLEV